MTCAHKRLEGAELLDVAKLFRILGEPARLRLLQELMEGERSVNDLTALTGGTQTNVSRHLKALSESGILNKRREGLKVFYSVSDPSVFEICDAVCRKHRSE